MAKRGKKGCIFTVFKGTDREFTGNYKEIAENFGMEYKVLYQRVRDFKEEVVTSKTVENAINATGYKNKYTVFKGTENEFTGTYRQIAEHFNIEYYKLIERKNHLNYSLEEAIKCGRGYGSNHIVFKGTDREFTGSYSDIANHFGIKYRNLYMYMYKHNGKTLDEVINNCIDLQHTMYIDLDISDLDCKLYELRNALYEDDQFCSRYFNNCLYVTTCNPPRLSYANIDFDHRTIVGIVKNIDFNRGKVKVYIKSNKLKNCIDKEHKLSIKPFGVIYRKRKDNSLYTKVYGMLLNIK